MWGIEGTISTKGSMQAQMRPGDWSCVSCGDMQFARNVTCRSCGAPRPSQPAADQELWGGGSGVVADSYGAAAGGSWGAWAQPGGEERSSPYGGGGGGGKGSWAAAGGGEKKKTDDMPNVVWLQLGPESLLCQQGFPDAAPAFAFDKSLEIFSAADHILWDFIPQGMDMKQVVEFHHDPECETFPDVHRAWKAAGQMDHCPTVATCPSLAKWACGFGGKAQGLRASKLAMALALATEADKTKLASVCENYPTFVQLLQAAGYDTAAAGITA